MADVLEKIDPEKLKKILKRAVKRGYKDEYKLPQKSFNLGYKVGHFGHMEGVGWVREKLDLIQKRADKFGLKKAVYYFFIKGKEVGREKRVAKQDLGKEKEGDSEGFFASNEIGEEFEVPDEALLTEFPQMVETFKALEVVPGVTMPKLFKMQRNLK